MRALDSNAPGGAAADPRPTLITGGAGFVGANLAHRLLSEGRPVLVLDNLSRPGVERNLAWLREQHPQGLDVAVADVRDECRRAARGRAARATSFTSPRRSR